MKLPSVSTKKAITGSYMVSCPFCKDFHFFILKPQQIRFLEGNIPDSHGSIDIIVSCIKTGSKFEIVKLEKINENYRN